MWTLHSGSKSKFKFFFLINYLPETVCFYTLVIRFSPLKREHMSRVHELRWGAKDVLIPALSDSGAIAMPLKMNRNDWFHDLTENKVVQVQFPPNKTPHLSVKGAEYPMIFCNAWIKSAGIDQMRVAGSPDLISSNNRAEMRLLKEGNSLFGGALQEAGRVCQNCPDPDVTSYCQINRRWRSDQSLRGTGRRRHVSNLS